MRGKRHFPFGYKLMISYVLLLIVPVALVGSIAYTTFVQSIREQTRANIAGTLQQIQDNITYRIEDTERISGLLYYDRTLADYLRRYEEGWYSYEATTKYLIPKLQNTINATDRNIALAAYVQNNALPEIHYTHNDTDPLLAKGKLYELYHLDRIKEKPWYVSLPEEQYGITMVWKQIEEDQQFGNISLLRRMVDTNDPTNITQMGMMRITVKIADLLQSVDYQKIREGSTLIITDAQQAVLHYSSGDPAFRPEQRSSLIAKGHLHIEHEQVIPGLGWKLSALIPSDALERDANRIRNLTIIICLISIVLFSFVGIFLSRYFAKRVTKIVAVLDAFRGGEFHKRFHYRGNDEFNHIASALNEMGENMNQLIHEVYVTNLHKKEAELESLQAQINPHFLYNTLSSINRLAQLGETDKLRFMVKGLAKFYRLTLNEGRTMIPIGKELQQANTYMDIQKIKYEERLSASYDIDERIIGYDTVKLILQPFIENVLEHAWYGDRIHIRITGRLEEDCIEFKVIDDGVGISQETIGQIFHPHGMKLGYGIRNVDQRIKLHFGEQYGVTIHSRLGIGTTVKITIPVYRHMDNQAD
ncbi:sensor histidine kinase [Paenibacillus sp. GCM10027626]|uniref:sensor histidine kinase n=1 Tax=Paenibacillus sp. GCM10027626 TaxID=3273411 RepID=UPI003644EAB8